MHHVKNGNIFHVIDQLVDVWLKNCTLTDKKKSIWIFVILICQSIWIENLLFTKCSLLKYKGRKWVEDILKERKKRRGVETDKYSKGKK